MPDNIGAIFVVDDDSAVRASVGQMLTIHGYDVVTFESGEEALASPRLVEAICYVVDILMPGMSGLELLEKLVERQVSGPVILMTGHGDIPMAVEAMKKGAYDFIEKPFDDEAALASVRRAAEKSRLLHQAHSLREKLKEARMSGEETLGLIGQSDAIARIRKKIIAYAASDVSVLIIGETGTGKELVARALHDNSSRNKGRFIAVNIAALPETLALGELFGYEKGAFTGAGASRQGKFEYASGGTLLLDEINSAPKSVQAGILRAVEEKTVTRLGSNTDIPVDTRILATTNQDIGLLVKQGAFRQDLLHRLDVASIHIPPLRDRPEDIGLMATGFLRDSCRFYDRAEITFSQRALRDMRAYSWPGNVRELKNKVVAMMLQCEDNEIGRMTFPEEKEGITGVEPLQHYLDRCEKEFITKVLRLNKGNLKSTATTMQTPQRSLYTKMQKYGLDKEDFK